MRLTVKAKLAGAFGLITVLTGLVGAVGCWKLSALDATPGSAGQAGAAVIDLRSRASAMRGALANGSAEHHATEAQVRAQRRSALS